MLPILDRALAARRASRRIAFRTGFDPGADRDWCELLRDIAAIANSGGGVILSPALPDLASILDRFEQVTDSDFGDLEIQNVERNGESLTVLLIGEAVTPIVFTAPCTNTFDKGMIFFRHGGSSRPATTEDLADAIDRRIHEVRRSWLTAVRRVVQSPVGAITAPSALPPEIRESDSPTATPIRVVDDPNVPAYRVVDYDRTHPYRQKELLAELHQRRPDVPVNQFDLQAVRSVYGIGANPDFSHQSAYGTRQYSPRFLEWLLSSLNSDPSFFSKARQQYRPRAQAQN